MVNEDNFVCPYCCGHLKHYDKVPRIVKSAGGIKTWIYIKRLKCNTCKRTHRVILDMLYPYKHYKKGIIDKVRIGDITPYTLDYEDYPCEMTMYRWIHSLCFYK